jgi:hypothetical protein
MTLTINILSQVLALLLHYFNLSENYFSPQTKMIISLVLAIAQTVVGTIAHQYNIDGTSQKTAYRPEEKI